MKEVKGPLLFLTAICLIMLSSCPLESGDPMAALQGLPKSKDQWGRFQKKIPNNIGNTFTGDPATTRTISWQSSVSTGEVIIDNILYPSTGIAYTYDSQITYLHRVDLTGLEPGKTYKFLAGSPGAYSPIYSFKTANSAYPDGFSIIHVTDPQIGTSAADSTDAEAWKRVIENAVKKCPDAAFIVSSGDLVNNINEKKIPFYFDYAQSTLAKYAFMYSMGNNDTLDWFNKYFYIKDQSASDTSGVLYSFDFGNAHFVSISMNYAGYTGDGEEPAAAQLSATQLAWLDNDLGSTSKKWKIVIIHKPDYARKNSTNANTDLAKLFDDHNVNLVLAGHYHFYMRSKPLDAAGNLKTEGTVWTIPNMAGTKFNPVSGQAYLAEDAQPNLPMFTELKFTAANICLNAYTVSASGVTVLYDSYTY